MNISDTYIRYAESLSELTEMELQIHNKKYLVHDLKEQLKNEENGSCGLEFTGHAFKQISERLEEIAMMSPVIRRDVFKDENYLKSLLLPSNLKPFIVTLLASAHKNGNVREEESKSSGKEYRYTVDMVKWSYEKNLQFIAIVENNFIKTGFFNWV